MANKYEYVADKYCLWRKLSSEAIDVQRSQANRAGLWALGLSLSLSPQLSLAKLVG